MNTITHKKNLHASCKKTARLFKLLSHPARLAILEILRHGEECVCHMEAALGFRQAYLSQQLSVLREAGIIQDRRDGWNIFYRVVEPDIYDVIDAACQTVSIDDFVRERVNPPDCSCPKCASPLKSSE